MFLLLAPGMCLVETFPSHHSDPLHYQIPRQLAGMRPSRSHWEATKNRLLVAGDFSGIVWEVLKLVCVQDKVRVRDNRQSGLKDLHLTQMFRWCETGPCFVDMYHTIISSTLLEL